MGNFYSYNFGGDAIAIILSIACWILLSSSYSVKGKNLAAFKSVNVLIPCSAVCSMVMNYLLGSFNEANLVWISVLYHAAYILMALTFDVFLVYMMDLFAMNKIAKIHATAFYSALTTLVVVWHILEQPLKLGFYIQDKQIVADPHTEVFHYVYFVYAGLLMIYMFRFRKRFITKMFWSLVSIASFGILIVIVEGLVGDRSFVIFSFMIPVFAVLFQYHYNAFDRDTGSLDENAFRGYIGEIKDRKFTIIYLQLKGISTMASVSPELKMLFYHFNESFFRKPITFRFVPGKMALVYLDDENPNAGTQQIQLFNEFSQLYRRFQIDYKIMVVSSHKKLQSGGDYINLVEYYDHKTDWNQVVHLSTKDVEDFSYALSVLKVITDIGTKKDLNDERVKVYCQPILNVESGKFTTAEALMRIETPELGLIFPDVFIPIAERFNYIHSLSCIILNKVCAALAEINKKYSIERISVNFSTTELKDDDFSNDILTIIKSHHIPCSQIALELTESRDTFSHDLVKSTMNTLKNYGIRMYMDDFGTGYSNFERILDLPIDIIKFDRSLTISSGENETSAYMVGNFATIFKKADYHILYEGIESGKDEQRCVDMQAEYLQGYRYSKPIPIEILPQFLEKLEK